MPAGVSLGTAMVSMSGCGMNSRMASCMIQIARSPVSPSGSAKQQSAKSSAPTRKAWSVESAGRLPTNMKSLVTRVAIEPSRCREHGFRFAPGSVRP
jgi:hypothetical protein